MIKAVIFDMYETLVSHYTCPLYFGKEISADAGISEETFQKTWRATDWERTVGKISFDEIIRKILTENDAYTDEKFNTIIAKRTHCKEECFETMRDDIIPMLSALKEKGIKIGLISDCFSEEAAVIRKSIVFPYFDAACLSYEEGMRKPDETIFYLCAERLGVKPDECLYVGDGGSSELIASASVGMTPFQARWYIQNVPMYQPRIDESINGGYLPSDILTFVEKENSKHIKTGIGVMIIDGGKILLGHRRADRKDTGGIQQPDSWALPGGKQEYGETILRCAAREVKEETNLDIDCLRVFSRTDDIAPDRHFVTLWVIAEKFSGNLKVMEEDKEDEWRWFSLDSLPENLYSPSKKFIDAYLESRR